MTIQAYGDTRGDGRIQLSFTLSGVGERDSAESARRFVLAMGLEDPEVAHVKELGSGLAFFVVYARTSVSLDDARTGVPERIEAWDRETIERVVREREGKGLTIVGACTGSDAHTVGLDSILNRKGFRGTPGLESYAGFRVVNLGAQVSNAALIESVRAQRADAILVSQVVTQKDGYLRNLVELVDRLEAEQMRDDVILVLGGPRVTPTLATELGFDAGFGAGTSPHDVASYIAQAIAASDPRRV